GGYCAPPCGDSPAPCAGVSRSLCAALRSAPASARAPPFRRLWDSAPGPKSGWLCRSTAPRSGPTAKSRVALPPAPSPCQVDSRAWVCRDNPRGWCPESKHWRARCAPFPIPCESLRQPFPSASCPRRSLLSSSCSKSLAPESLVLVLVFISEKSAGNESNTGPGYRFLQPTKDLSPITG